MNASDKKRDIVLIVDDSPDTLGMLNDILDNAGYTALVALEGNQALTIADNIHPDIILMDAIMPNMDGFETCKRLKANRDLAHIPVVFMTGLSDTESVVKGLESGGVDYISKPINGEEMIARMRVHLINSRQTMSARAALDNAGQYLFAVDTQGKLLWHTPKTQHLIEASDLSAGHIEAFLATNQSKIFNPIGTQQKCLAIPEGDKPLGVRYVGQIGGNEYLLRLVDLDRPDEIDVLRSTFKVTEREAEVLLWIARGKTNREIGTILSMSPRTVNKHLEQIFRKLSVENRTTAAIQALKHLESDL